MRAPRRARIPCIGALDVCPLVWIADAERATRARAGAGGGDRDRGARGAGVPLRRARHRRRAARARLLSPRRPRRRSAGGCARASCPGLRPAAPHPTAGATLVTARAAAGGLQRRARHGRRRGRARDRGPRCASPAAGSRGVRAIAIDLGDRAQISTNVHDPIGVPLGAVIERGARAGRRARCARRSPARSSAWSRRPRSAAFRRTCRCPASTPTLHVLERRLAAAASAAHVVHVPPLVGPVDLRPAVDGTDLVDHRPHLGAREVDRGPVLVRRAPGRVRRARRRPAR